MDEHTGFDDFLKVALRVRRRPGQLTQAQYWCDRCEYQCMKSRALTYNFIFTNYLISDASPNSTSLLEEKGPNSKTPNLIEVPLLRLVLEF